MKIYNQVAKKIDEELHAKRILYKQDPETIVQVASLLEDFGLIKVLDDDVTFDKAMFQTSFILPDPVINMLLVGSALYAVVAGGLL